MKIGIVGLPNVGKSTLFNALTKSYSADAANFPFCTIEPNVGIVNVHDNRIDALAGLIQNPNKNLVYATTKFVDIAGLVKGASEGQGLGNKFLSHIREVDAIVQVVRHFEDGEIMHVEGSTDPFRDIEIINTELIMADLEQIIDKIPQAEKRAKSGDKEAIKIHSALSIVGNALKQGKLAIDVEEDLKEDEKKVIQGYQLLTFKPFVYAVNVSIENLLDAKRIQAEFSSKLNKPVCIVCARFESEMMEYSPEEKNEFIKSYGESTHSDHIPTLDDLIKTAFDTLGLMYYFTTGEKETRARTIKKNSTAPQAAGAIHTDFERGFIKAEVVSCENLLADGSRAKAKENGHVALQGKDYIVKDGDVIVFKFNV